MLYLGPLFSKSSEVSMNIGQPSKHSQTRPPIAKKPIQSRSTWPQKLLKALVGDQVVGQAQVPKRLRASDRSSQGRSSSLVDVCWVLVLHPIKYITVLDVSVLKIQGSKDPEERIVRRRPRGPSTLGGVSNS